jgi:HEPN domain-containing protein
MQPPNPIPGSAEHWLQRARGKLARARAPLPPGGFLEDLCFDAQQAAELAIKAVYQQQGWMFAYVHDLQHLLDGLRQNGLPIPQAVQEAFRLTDYATVTRYPGPYAPVTQAEYEEAVRIADAVIAWASALIP